MVSSFRKALAQTLLLLSPALILFTGATIENTGSLISRGQHRFQGHNYHECGNVEKKATEQRELSVGIYDTSGQPSDVSQYMNHLSTHVNRAFNEIGIEIKLNYRTIEDNLSEVETREFEGKKKELEEWLTKLKEDVNQGRTYNPEENWDAAYQYGVDRVAYLLNERRESLQKWRQKTRELFRTLDVVEEGGFPYILAPLEDLLREQDDILVLFHDRPNNGGDKQIAGAERYGLIGIYKDSDKPNVRRIANTLTHELGHSIGLGHSTFIPDVMSYSSIARWLPERVPEFSFGVESIIEWEIIKNKCHNYTKEYVVEQSQPTAMQFVGNSKDYQFYRRHGYTRRPPKKLGVRR